MIVDITRYFEYS